VNTQGAFQITEAIAQLRAERQKIDMAIEALESLAERRPIFQCEGSSSVAIPIAYPAHPKARTSKTAKPKPRKAKPKAEKKAGGTKRRQRKDGEPSTHDLVVGVLKSGPKRPGAVIAALKGKAAPNSVYTMLSYLHSHGETRKNEDLTYSLVGRA